MQCTQGLKNLLDLGNYRIKTMSVFSEKQINDVWEKDRIIFGMDWDVYRKDAAGAIIKKD